MRALDRWRKSLGGNEGAAKDDALRLAIRHFDPRLFSLCMSTGAWAQRPDELTEARNAGRASQPAAVYAGITLVEALTSQTNSTDCAASLSRTSSSICFSLCVGTHPALD